MERLSVRYSGNWLLGRRAAFSREIVCKTRPPTASHPLPANQSTETMGDTTMALVGTWYKRRYKSEVWCVHRVVMICTACVHRVVMICTACVHRVATGVENCHDEQSVNRLVCVSCKLHTCTLAHLHTHRTVCYRAQKLMMFLN
jgi:hypothetical protein